MTDYSISPTGEKFPIPQKDDYAPELKRLAAFAETARAEGKEVVVVMGVGFVGAVMAASAPVRAATGRFRFLIRGFRR
jgi:hypothetical protein